MRWIALTMALALAAPAAAQDEEPILGVSSAEPEAPAEHDAEARSGTASAADEDAAGEAMGEEGAAEDQGAAEEGEAADAADEDADDDEGDAEDAGDASEEDEEEEEDDVVGDAPRAGPRWTDARVGAWAGFGASFGVSILGGVLLAVGVDDLNTIENAPGGTVWADVAGARDRAPILTGIGAAVLGLGVAGMAVSAGLLAYFGQEGTWLEVSVLPGGLAVRGRF